jgi:bifunctional DNA-binding transcriptional regulator/antitoxin component of YhaV-PrlF toxin-antitoxin module
MNVTAKRKNQLIVPPSVQRRARIKNGDQVEYRVSGGLITIIPKLPSADDEYTQEQRRSVDAQLAEGLEDIRKGRVRTFDTAEEMLASMKGRKRSSRRPKSRSR